MAGLNKVMIIGNVGADPEMRYTADGNAVTTFRVATNFNYTTPNGERREETILHQRTEEYVRGEAFRCLSEERLQAGPRDGPVRAPDRDLRPASDEREPPSLLEKEQVHPVVEGACLRGVPRGGQGLGVGQDGPRGGGGRRQFAGKHRGRQALEGGVG